MFGRGKLTYGLLLLATVLTTARPAAAQGRGDVNGDGKVDGVDALYTLQSTKGTLILTAEQRERADVHPLPGRDGRVVGDGQVTEEDATRILQHLLGLITRAELTGDFDGPYIAEFAPGTGAAGTRVTLYGANFAAGRPAENVVKLGSLTLPALSATSTEIAVEIPQGAESAAFTLTTPGGTTTTVDEFAITSAQAGQLVTPAGLDVSRYTVASPYDTAVPDAQGHFSVPVAQDAVNLISAVPPAGDERLLLRVDFGGGATRQEPQQVDMLSTAQSMIFMSPLFIDRDPVKARWMLASMDGVPEVGALVAALTTAYASPSDPLADAAVQQALDAAIIAVVDKLSKENKVTEETTRAASRAEKRPSENVRFGNLDLAALDGFAYDFDDKLYIDFKALYGQPLDWVLRIRELDVASYPDWSSNVWQLPLREAPKFVDGGANITTNVPGRAFFSAWDPVFLLFELLNKMEREVSLPLKRDTIYLARAYSGCLADGKDAGEVDFLRSNTGDLPGGIKEARVATAVNVINIVRDILALVWAKTDSSKPVWTSRALLVVNFVTKNPEECKTVSGVLRLVMTLVGDIIAFPTREGAMPPAADGRSRGLGDAAKVTWSFVSRLWGVTKGSVDKVFQNPIYKALVVLSSAGRIGEVAFGLSGKTLGGNISPMETALIVVGDPFSPKITQFPPEVAPGEEITLRGERFSKVLAENRVLFAGREGAVTSANAEGTELKAKVPPVGPQSAAQITVRARRGEATAGPVKIHRAPAIAAVSPAIGFPARDSFMGDPYTGTKVTLTGSYFSRKYVGGAWVIEDKILFQGAGGLVEAPVEHANSSSDSVVVYVPQGAQSGKIVARTPEGRQSESPLPFTVPGIPTVNSAVTTEARAGDPVQVIGSGFHPEAGDVWMGFYVGGQDVYRGIWNGTDSWISSVMPSEAPEQADIEVWVETPSGRSNKVAVKRLAGRAEGITLTNLEPSGAAIPNGKLSLGEAVRLVQGDLDIFDTPGGWDDADVVVTEEVTTFYDADNVYLRSESAYQVTSRGSRGHAGPEMATVNSRYYSQIAGHARTLTGEGSSQSSLDNPNTTTIGTLGASDIPGIGKVEEGDFVPDMRWGKDFADKIRANLGGTVTADLSFGVDGAGDDSLEFLGVGTLDGKITLANSGNTLFVYPSGGNATTVTGRVEIAGRRNSVQHLTLAGGIAVQGSMNVLEGLTVGNTATRLAKGIELTGGATANRLSTVTVDNCEVGVEISGGAQGNDVTPAITNCGVGMRITGAGTRHNTVPTAGWYPRIGFSVVNNQETPGPCDTGLEISGGAEENHLTISIHHCTGDAVVIRDAGTRLNHVEGSFQKNGGNGFHVFAGAAENRMVGNRETWASGDVQGNALYGVLIEGAGTDRNQVENASVHGNGKAGVAVLGQADAEPFGNRIVGAWMNQQPEGCVLARNLQRAEGETLVIRESSFEGYADPPTAPGVVLENVRGALLEANRFTLQDNLLVPVDGKGFTTGILITGEKSTANTSRLDALGPCGVAGIRITGGAWGNLVENPTGAYLGSVGILVDGSAHDNGVVVRPELVADIGGRIRRGGILSGGAVGVALRGGAKDNLVSGCSLSNCTDSAVIEGAGTSGNTVRSCRVSRVVVQGGAVNTILGSTAAGQGNTFATSKGEGLLVSGAQTHGLQVLGSHFFGSAKEAIAIDGAQDVTIGSGLAGNTFMDAGAQSTIRVTGATNVTVAGNTLDTPQPTAPTPTTGIRIDGGSTGVVVGGQTARDGNTIFHHHHDIVVAGPDTHGVSLLRNKLPSGPPEDGQAGIRILDGARDVTVASNEIYGFKQDGVQILGGATTGVTVERNQIDSNERNGVTIAEGAHDNTVRLNRINQNASYGVELGAGTGRNAVMEGAIFDNTQGGIHAGLPVPPRITLVRENTVLGEVDLSVDSGTLVQVYADLGKQGKQFLGCARVHGKAWSLKAAVPPALNITATVTDHQGNTSAFGEVGVPSVRPALLGSQMLVFSSTRDGNAEIYAQRAGDSAVRLTNDPAADHSPTLSPGAAAIAFVSERSGNPDVWGMGNDGSNPTPLTSHAAPDYDPAWSADGKKLAFVSERDGNPEIYLMSATGGAATRLTSSAGVDRHPCWSPDGSKIAFTSDRGGNADVWVMNADGSGAAALPGSPQADYDPAWSPDGSRIAFVSERDGNPEIYVIGADGSTPARLTQDPAADREPAWSPNGEWVAFSSARPGDAELFARQVASGRLERLTVSLGMNVQPAWSGAAGTTRMAQLRSR